MSNKKPKFDPNKPFEAVEDKKPAFDPNKSFEVLADVDDEIPEISKLRSGLTGAEQGLTFNYSDEIIGGVKALGEKVSNGIVEGPSLGELYDKNVAEQRQRIDEAAKANPLTYAAGNVAGGVVSSMIPGIGAIGKMGLVRGGIAAGALAGSGMGEGLKGTIEGAGKGALIGGAAGVGLKAASNMGRSVVEAAKKFLDPEQARLAAVGVTNTKALAKTGVGSPREAIKIAQRNGVFEGTDDIEIVRDRLEDMLDLGAKQVDEILTTASSKGVKVSPNLSELDELARTIEQKAIDAPMREGAIKIRNLANSLREKISAGDGVDLLELQEIKRTLQQRAKELGAYKGADNIKDLTRAYSRAANSVKVALEQATDGVVEKGALKAANESEWAAINLLPSVEKRIAGEAKKALNPLGKLKSVLDIPAEAAKSALPESMGMSSQGLLQRAALGERLPRSVDGILAKKDFIIQKVGELAPEALPEIQKIFSLPKAKVAQAVLPLVALFKDQFEPSPYDSMIDGKIMGVQDQELHRKFIQDSVKSPVKKAKLLGALNKDGTYIPMTELEQSTPTAPAQQPTQVAPRREVTVNGLAQRIKERQY